MCAYKTAWSRSASSLPSDRIPPSNQSQRRNYGGPKDGSGKGKQKDTELPQSKEVRSLEELKGGLAGIVGKDRIIKDPKGGCYCQARKHALSTYVPLCRRCGLILCEVNQPYYACPHCAAPLLSSSAIDSLIASVEQYINDTLAREEREREQAVEEARRAAGAFPVLGPSNSSTTSLLTNSRSSTPPADTHPVNQPHKVLSLNSKTKKVTVASYTKPQPMKASVPKSQEAPPDPEPVRVSRPPRDILVSSKEQDPDRPWANARGFSVIYVPPPKQKGGTNAGRKGKTKTKQKQEAGSQQGTGKQNNIS